MDVPQATPVDINEEEPLLPLTPEEYVKTSRTVATCCELFKSNNKTLKAAALETMRGICKKPQKHAAFLEGGGLECIVHLLTCAADDLSSFDEGSVQSEVFIASHIAAFLAWPEEHTEELVAGGIIPPCVRLVHVLGKTLLRKEVVRVLLSISESIWLRGKITESVHKEIPPADLGEEASFNMRIQNDPWDAEELTFWTEILKNCELTTSMYYPGKKAWWDSNDFPQLKILEEHWEEIRDEALEAIQQFLVAWPEKNICEKGWNVFPFKAFDNKLDKMCAIAPKTFAILEQIPNVTTALFSTLRPRIHIKPHVGYYQYSEKVLRVHLGLVIPEGCVLVVNGERRTWQEGKITVFDDTFRHEAWNASFEKTRIVLMFDIHADVDESLRNPVFMEQSRERGALFGESALISSDLTEAFASLGGCTDNITLRPEDRAFI